MIHSARLRFYVAIATVLSAAAVPAWADPVTASDGMVVSASRPASEAGVEILAQGGNAFDAAAATGFALAVTHPSAGNLGGGGFLVAHTADGKVLSLDFRETAPARASRDMFLDEDGEVVPRMSLDTVFASGTPGSPKGLLAIWSELGSGAISREQLLAPSIRLAREGFPVSEHLAGTLNAVREKLDQSKAGRAVFVRGELWKAGDRLVQPDLTVTLERIAEHGARGFYEGPTADALVAYMRAAGGLIRHQDLQSYEAKWRDPTVVDYRGMTVVSMPPPSSGGLLLALMLNMLEAHDLPTLGWQTPAYIHLLTEVQRRAYADRATHMGDSDYWDVPGDMLRDKVYALTRMQGFSPERATPSTSVRAGRPAPLESDETTHYSVADSNGNVAAVTVTLNAGYGSGLMAPGTGFLLNNEMDDFSAKPGVPNLYGVTGGDANAIEPGKRMLSSMSPTIVLRDGTPWLVLGSPGGSTIPTTVLQILLSCAEFGMPIDEAVAAPRHHSQWLPDRVFVEDDRFARETLATLESMGHVMITRSDVSSVAHIGVANCIAIEDGQLIGAPDPRTDCAAVGFSRSD